LVAANRSAPARVTCVGWGQRHDQDATSDLADHEPVCRRRLGRVEERVRAPHLVDVVHAKSGMLEEVRRLVVDFERVLVVENIDVEKVTHTRQVYYNRIPHVPAPPQVDTPRPLRS
jgi:hypothetical protein